MGLSRLKTGSRKYGRDTPSPASRSISVFFRKYENRQNKYRNTGGTGRNFFRPFSSLPARETELLRQSRVAGARGRVVQDGSCSLAVFAARAALFTLAGSCSM